MKTIHKITALVMAPLALYSCANISPDPSEIDTTTRIVLSKDIEEFTYEGKTASGADYYEAIVTIVRGSEYTTEWTFEVSDPKNCATVEKADVTELFLGTYAGDADVVKPGLRVSVAPNESYRRTFDVTVTADDGTEATFTFTQLGLLEDASVTSDISSIDFPAAGGDYVITYTSNMGDVVSYSIVYADGTENWLSYSSSEVGSVTLTAQSWTDEENTREATFIITVGTEDTSMASLEIPIVQLALREYYYMYGASVYNTTIENALQMTESSSSGVYTISEYFNNAVGGASNAVLFNKDSRTFAYPYYALASDGTVSEITDANTTLPVGPTIDIDGMRRLTVDFDNLTWSWERITNTLSMPDDLLSEYPTKDYITRDGVNYKTWMTVSLHWDGGDLVSTYKLGSGLVAGHQTGGYGNTGETYLTDRNSAYDTVENGGSVEEVYDTDGQPLANKKGRLYSGYEAINAVATGCLNYQDLMDFLTEEFVDAVGNTIPVVEQITTSMFAGLSDDDVEALYPQVTSQIQGICPYGWHIANLADWMDIFYAAYLAQASDDNIDASVYNYSSISNSTTLSNLGRMFYEEDFAYYVTTYASSTLPISSNASDFGFNMFCQGWRLRRTGYDYGPGDETPRFYTIIPMRGQYTSSKKAAWRVYSTASAHLYVNDGFDFGNGCGAAIRCVKNYKEELLNE